MQRCGTTCDENNVRLGQGGSTLSISPFGRTYLQNPTAIWSVKWSVMRQFEVASLGW